MSLEQAAEIFEVLTAQHVEVSSAFQLHNMSITLPVAEGKAFRRSSVTYLVHLSRPSPGLKVKRPDSG